ncbi:MAG: DUF2062 domain-containing protein [Candidatus Rokubacteria bacterium]|nr:DUF2062 domain-containing protein [Candidatus Rokubacteria bacterium]
MTPLASVVVRARNEGAFIGRLLHGIRAQDCGPVEVVLVDSGSTDDTRAIATSYGCRVVDMEPERFTYGRALNVGCEAARAPVCVLVSAHCFPANDRWLSRLVRPLADRDVAGAYGKQLPLPGTLTYEQRNLLTGFPARSQRQTSSYFFHNANAAILARSPPPSRGSSTIPPRAPRWPPPLAAPRPRRRRSTRCSPPSTPSTATRSPGSWQNEVVLRRLLDRLTGLLRLDDPPWRIALALAVGVFISCTPTPGLQTIIALVVATLVRLNRAATVTGVWLNLPWVMPFVYAGALKVGAAVVPDHAAGFWVMLVVGTTIVGAVAAIVTYCVSFGALSWTRRRMPAAARGGQGFTPGPQRGGLGGGASRPPSQ